MVGGGRNPDGAGEGAGAETEGSGAPKEEAIQCFFRIDTTKSGIDDLTVLKLYASVFSAARQKERTAFAVQREQLKKIGNPELIKTPLDLLRLLQQLLRLCQSLKMFFDISTDLTEVEGAGKENVPMPHKSFNLFTLFADKNDRQIVPLAICPQNLGKTRGRNSAQPGIDHHQRRLQLQSFLQGDVALGRVLDGKALFPESPDEITKGGVVTGEKDSRWRCGLVHICA